MKPRTLLPAALAIIAACGARTAPIPASVPAPSDRIAIVASERGPQGARLVAIDEHGDRQFELIQAATGPARDANPAVSPDGAWLVFASSRDRPLDETSLWIAQGGQPGELTRLTHGPGHEVTPAIAPDGAIIYAAVTPDAERREIETHLEERAPDGAIRALTAGPADSSPAVSPDGTRLVFARPQIHGGKADSELWLMVRATGAIAPLVDLPLTDESGPVWSRDGRFVFATSVLRGAEGRVVFSSIIHVDTREIHPVARILEDRVGAIVRLTPAMTANPLDAAALRGDPEYLPELAHIMSRIIEQQTGQHEGTP